MEGVMSDFKSQQEIWQYLIDGGKVCPIDSLPGSFFTFDHGFISNEDESITECSFHHPHKWKKYIEPKKKKVITLYSYIYTTRVFGEVTAKQTCWTSRPWRDLKCHPGEKLLSIESKEIEVDDE
jgi:hypothetical protein